MLSGADDDITISSCTLDAVAIMAYTGLVLKIVWLGLIGS